MSLIGNEFELILKVRAVNVDGQINQKILSQFPELTVEIIKRIVDKFYELMVHSISNESNIFTIIFEVTDHPDKIEDASQLRSYIIEFFQNTDMLDADNRFYGSDYELNCSFVSLKEL